MNDTYFNQTCGKSTVGDFVFGVQAGGYIAYYAAIGGVYGARLFTALNAILHNDGDNIANEMVGTALGTFFFVLTSAVSAVVSMPRTMATNELTKVSTTSIENIVDLFVTRSEPHNCTTMKEYNDDFKSHERMSGIGIMAGVFVTAPLVVIPEGLGIFGLVHDKIGTVNKGFAK
ncbi:hypothetical protein Cyrtocomes_00766 [Candidatus Cyrtobacter comes]|uniref:H(+)-exporting diphosphatase n=1 Tax=Candidatus Cyrtobacter comes TaxID=675776 RepID=A0ABU5L8D6_9RICK|nr:hypothetical protein [Candidatus Cyrtobacter comes]MDZ5762386.1 hypothetical protein [Candidatus Cyrtobacter comes]